MVKPSVKGLVVKTQYKHTRFVMYFVIDSITVIIFLQIVLPFHAFFFYNK